MGPVASILALAVFVGLVWSCARAWSATINWPVNASNDADVELLVSQRLAQHAGRILLTLLVIVYGVALLDAFVVDVRMPFAAREADLGAHGPPPPATPALRIEAQAKSGPTVADDHRSGVREWESVGGR